MGSKGTLLARSTWGEQTGPNWGVEGWRLNLCQSYPSVYSTQLLERQGLLQHFQEMQGSVLMVYCSSASASIEVLSVAVDVLHVSGWVLVHRRLYQQEGFLLPISAWQLSCFVVCHQSARPTSAYKLVGKYLNQKEKKTEEIKEAGVWIDTDSNRVPSS